MNYVKEIEYIVRICGKDNIPSDIDRIITSVISTNSEIC